MRKLAACAILFGLALGPIFPRILPGSPKLRIVASILPLMEFARAVAGENAEVSLLLPPGAGVHTWQPRASDIIRMSKADLFVHVGGGLEPWVEDFLGSVSNKRLRVLAVADFLPLEKEKHAGGEAVDPHVWLDFGNDLTIIEHLARTLGEIDAGHADAYRDLAAVYNEKLGELDRQYAQGLESCSNRVLLLAGHEAFGYLARRYHLEQVSLTGLSPDAEPTPSAVVFLVETARKRRVGAVFREARESPRLAELLAREIPAKIFVLNPGENLSRQEWTSGTTFLDLMRENLVNLRKGLGCE
jgi:zinc transport system substrate-binding protein